MSAYIPQPREGRGDFLLVAMSYIIGISCVLGGAALAVFSVLIMVRYGSEPFNYLVLCFSWLFVSTGAYAILSSKISKRLWVIRSAAEKHKWLWDAAWDKNYSPAIKPLSRSWHTSLVCVFYPGITLILLYMVFSEPKAPKVFYIFPLVTVFVCLCHYFWYQQRLREKQTLCYYPSFPLYLNSPVSVEVRNLPKIESPSVAIHYVRESTKSKSYSVNGERKTANSTMFENEYSKELSCQFIDNNLHVPLDLSCVAEKENNFKISGSGYWVLELDFGFGPSSKIYRFLLPIYKVVENEAAR